MQDFMSVAQIDMPSFFVDTYLEFDHVESKFALFLSDAGNAKGYVILLNPYTQLHENHKAISTLFNTVLEQTKCDKRFTLQNDSAINENEIQIVTYGKENSIEAFIKGMQKMQ